jgi:hypothetical protein
MRASGLDSFGLPAPRCRERARQRVAGKQAEPDAGGIFDVVPPFKSRFRKDRVTRAQALRYGHAGDRNDAEGDRDRDRCPGTASALPGEQDTGNERHPDGNDAEISGIEIERIDDDVMRNEQSDDRHDQVPRQVGGP